MISSTWHGARSRPIHPTTNQVGSAFGACFTAQLDWWRPPRPIWWTDYALDGEQVRPEVMEQARLMMVDHRMIGKGFAPNGPIEFFGPEDALQEHLATRAWLTQRLAGSSGPDAARTVVITHHAPHPSSIHARFAGDSLNPAFVTDLTPLMDGVDLWIHGHVHNTFDYQVQRCRVVANPRGYPLNLRARPRSMGEVMFESPEFIAGLVLEV